MISFTTLIVFIILLVSRGRFLYWPAVISLCALTYWQPQTWVLVGAGMWVSYLTRPGPEERVS